MTDEKPKISLNAGVWWFVIAMAIAVVISIGFAWHMAALAGQPSTAQVGG